MMRNIVLPIVVVIVLIFQACTVKYTTTGASISPDVETVSVEYFPSRAPLAMANLGQIFTDALKDKFLSQTSLTLVEDNGHLNFRGEITDYRTQPVAIQGDETAAQNRLTIAVRVEFTNEKDSEFNYESTFSRYRDYDSNQSLSAVEQQLSEEIVEELIEDIFNKAVVNW